MANQGRRVPARVPARRLARPEFCGTYGVGNLWFLVFCAILTIHAYRDRSGCDASHRARSPAPNEPAKTAAPESAARVLDLGCGEGAWALQALAHHPDGHADGGDVNPYALERAAGAAAERGLANRLTLHERDARTYVPDGGYDLVLCVGSTHALGGFGETLELAGRHVNADGILMVGEGFWQVPPTPEALAALNVTPEDFTDLAGLVDAAEALAVARKHRDQWLRGYRSGIDSR